MAGSERALTPGDVAAGRKIANRLAMRNGEFYAAVVVAAPAADPPPWSSHFARACRRCCAMSPMLSLSNERGRAFKHAACGWGSAMICIATDEV